MGSIAEAWLAIGSGAAAVELVSEMPSGPGVISEHLIAEIAAELPPAIGSFLLTCKTDPQAIIDQQRRLRVNTIQICDRLQLPRIMTLARGPARRIACAGCPRDWTGIRWRSGGGSAVRRRRVTGFEISRCQ